MTREEAISRLKEGEPFSEIYDPVWDEALKVAISALSAPSANVISIDQANAMIKSYVSHYEANKGEWIPVSERLPEKIGFYLCTVGATWKNPRVMKYEPKECVNDAYLWQGDDDSYVYNWFVEAWQPLPEPYKAEKGGE